jgi:hypothetical protein
LLHLLHFLLSHLLHLHMLHYYNKQTIICNINVYVCYNYVCYNYELSIWTKYVWTIDMNSILSRSNKFDLWLYDDYMIYDYTYIHMHLHMNSILSRSNKSSIYDYMIYDYTYIIHTLYIHIHYTYTCIYIHNISFHSIQGFKTGLNLLINRCYASIDSKLIKINILL